MLKQVALFGIVISSLVTVSLVYSFGWIAVGLGCALGLGAMMMSMGGLDDQPAPVRRVPRDGSPTTFMGGL